MRGWLVELSSLPGSGVDGVSDLSLFGAAGNSGGGGALVKVRDVGEQDRSGGGQQVDRRGPGDAGSMVLLRGEFVVPGSARGSSTANDNDYNTRTVTRKPSNTAAAAAANAESPARPRPVLATHVNILLAGLSANTSAGITGSRGWRGSDEDVRNASTRKSIAQGTQIRVNVPAWEVEFMSSTPSGKGTGADARGSGHAGGRRRMHMLTDAENGNGRPKRKTGGWGQDQVDCVSGVVVRLALAAMKG